MFRSFSCSGGVRRRRTSQASFSSGMTLRKMSVAMKSEQIGSAINQPNWRMRMVEMITPTLPKVSARTWRNTPGREGTDIQGLIAQRRRVPSSSARTPHVGVHASAARAVGVAVASVGVASVGVAVLAVGVAVVRVSVVVGGAALAPVGVGVAERADPHQVDQQTADRHRLRRERTGRR